MSCGIINGKPNLDPTLGVKHIWVPPSSFPGLTESKSHLITDSKSRAKRKHQEQLKHYKHVAARPEKAQAWTPLQIP